MTQLAFRFLGQFQISINENPVTDFHSDKARALLAYLALEPREHKRDFLAALLWPDIDEQYARTNLRNTLYRLRQTLDAAAPSAADQLLTVTRQSVQFTGASAGIDVHRFQTLIDDASADPTAHLDQLAAAVDAYQGELLAGFSLTDAPPFEEWLLLQRELLHLRALLVFHALVTTYEAGGRFSQALAVANRLLALDPFREESHRQLMQLLARMGQPEQALRQLEQLRRILRAEMGVEPSTETLALAEQIVAGDFAKVTGDKVAGGKVADTVSSHPLTLSPPHLVTPSSTLDLRDVPDPGPFFGRAQEQQQLTQWLRPDRCRVAAILGIGGMGKTSLAAQTVRQLAAHVGDGPFEVVLWRSLLNAPPLTELLPPLLQALSDQQLTEMPASLDEQLHLLLDYLRAKRVLLVLDNLESILEPGQAGAYRSGYEPYDQLIQQMATLDHQSHLLLTSRERPRGYARLERDVYPVYSLQLAGLDDAAGRTLLAQRGVTAKGDAESTLIKRYSGNPLALKLVADTVDEVFGGDVAGFLAEETLVFDDVRDVLDQQFARLSALEQDILFWLAVERAETSVSMLRDNLLDRPSQREFVEALRDLQRRSLIERQGNGFLLQNVINEYLTDRLVAGAIAEVEQGELHLLHRHALLKAQAKEYVRQSQVRLIVTPIARRLSRTLSQQGLTARLQNLLGSLSEPGTPVSNYAGGNILNLLVHLEIDMRGFDFSQLTLREAYLQDASLIDTNFTHVEFVNTVFTNSFGPVFWVTVSSDDQLMAAGFDNGEIGLWRLPNAQQVRILVGHERRVRWVAFSPDNRRLVSASLDHTVRLWDVETGHCLQTICTHQKGVHTAVFSPDGRIIASGGQDHLVHLWDVASGHMLSTLPGHSDWINAIAFHPDGHLLASASHDNTIRLWDLPTITERLPTSENPLLGILDGQFRIVALAFSPDGTLLASGAGDSTVCIWDVESQHAVQTLHGHIGWVRGVAFSPDGSRMASGATDQLIRLWAAPEWNIADVLHGHMDEIASLTFNADGKMLISSAGQEIKLWDMSNPHQGQAIRTLRGGTRPINCVTFSPDGFLIASGHRQGAIHLWRVAQEGGSAHFQRALLGHVGIVTSVAFSPDGATLASASHDGSIRLWDVGSGACLAMLLHNDKSKINRVAYTPNGSMLISAGTEGTLHLWRINAKGDWMLDDILSVPTRVVHGLAISSDGRLLAHGTADRSVYVWDLDSKQQIRRFEGFAQDFWSLVFLPQNVNADQTRMNAELLVGGNRSGVIYMWNLAAEHPEQPVQTIHAHDSVLRGLALNPITGYLASCSEDHTIKVWDIDRGQVRHTLKGHAEIVMSVDLRHDGRILVSGGTDGVIKLWNMENGASLTTLHTPSPYEGMNITGVTGISDAQRTSLKALGAVEQ